MYLILKIIYQSKQFILLFVFLLSCFKKKLLFIIVLLLSCVCTMSAQSVVAFAGQVMTKDGEPVIGATVQVKGQPGVGVVTDADGHFRLNNLKIGQTVTFSYIGYTTIHMPVKRLMKECV